MGNALKSFALTSPLDPKGVAIPIFATFGGHKAAPFLALSHNALSHKLRFFENEVEFRIFETRRRVWSEIESVDARIVWKTVQLTLNFVGTPWNFTANMVLPRTLRETLGFLDKKGLALSERARQILTSDSP